MVISPRDQISLALIVLASLVPMSASSQEIADLVALPNDARGIALGGAMTALASGPNAIGWNPAGLFATQRREWRVDLCGQAGVASTSPEGPNPDSKVLGHWSLSHLVPQVEFVGVVQPFQFGRRRAVAGLGWRSLVAGSRESKMATTEWVAWADRHRTHVEHRVSSGDVRAVSGSLSFRARDRLVLGTTASLLHGSHLVETNDTVRFFGAPTSSTTSEEYRDQRGRLFELGALAEVTPSLRLGLRVALPHTRTGTLVRSGEPNVTFEHSLPASFAIGLGWQQSPRRTWSVDVRNEGLSASTLRDVDADTAIATSFGMADVLSLHAGFEFRESTDPRASRWRFGVFAQPSSIVDIQGQQITSLGLSVGRGWIFGRRGLDVALRYQRGSEWTRSNGSPTVTMRNSEFRMVTGILLHRTIE